MSDLQVISIQDVVPVSQVSLITGTSIFKIRGRDFRRVTEVQLNDVPSTFAIESSTMLLVDRPASLETARLRTVLVLSNTFTLTEKSVIKNKLGTSLLSGLTSLAQLFVKILMTTPGRDVYRPAIGGALLDLVGQVAGSPDRPDLKTSFMLSVTQTRDQILELQSRTTTLPADERLAAAEVVSVRFDPQTGTLQGRVELISMAGDAALVNLVA